jgi:uncharacterized SAM-binding protein YcdF (DUF218 family)
VAADRVAAALLVLGNGVARSPDGWTLSAGSATRVRAAVDYVHAVGAPARIVFSGGWAEAREGADMPPDGCREGDLMRRAAALEPYAETFAECRSRSTLENLLNSVVEGPLAGLRFDAAHPLGVVTHPWHLPRVRYLAGRVLGLRGAALLDIPAAGPERGGVYEHAVRMVSKVWFLGALDAAGLLRRERRMVALMRRGVRGV